ncbi:ATP-binding cassette domain-containing protein [Paenibacillus campinasensis]|uniref:ATP-binding cassette domain-containing protein n=1 Tax=Paenibacillus campinasensis TaxID=66347 RepID=A0ABW9T8S2_9BACL|nr:ABC transporter ATP-binding protein [Paenibacillus campinasensis]MUG69012.1 ATP-binding cassette domain-containing protein [Paenibacillus campinasensis]
MTEHRLITDKIRVGYDKKIIIDGMDVEIPSNKISVIIGANGCGKSTLLKSFSRLVKPDEGCILLDGKEILSYPSKSLARIMGLLPQAPVIPEGITVFDLVSRGRYPHRSLLQRLGEADMKAIEEAMNIMGVSEIANRNIDELSGGQRQRVWIALALAQQTDILLLDEPTTFLDIAYQVEILDRLTDLNLQRGTTIVMVLHDINLAARYGDYIFAIESGKLIAQGKPADVISPELVRAVFHVDCTVIRDPVFNSPVIISIKTL